MSIQIQLHGFHGPKSKGTSHLVISEETIYLQREMRNALDKVQGMLENYIKKSIRNFKANSLKFKNNIS